jgi:hypothetical protein
MRRVAYGFLSIIPAFLVLASAAGLLIHVLFIGLHLQGGCDEWLFATRPCAEYPPEPLFLWVLNALVSGVLFALLMGLAYWWWHLFAKAINRTPPRPERAIPTTGIAVCAYTFIPLSWLCYLYVDTWVDYADPTRWGDFLEEPPTPGNFPAGPVSYGLVTFGVVAVILVALIARSVKVRGSDVRVS